VRVGRYPLFASRELSKHKASTSEPHWLPGGDSDVLLFSWKPIAQCWSKEDASWLYPSNRCKYNSLLLMLFHWLQMRRFPRGKLFWAGVQFLPSCRTRTFCASISGIPRLFRSVERPGNPRLALCLALNISSNRHSGMLLYENGKAVLKNQPLTESTPSFRQAFGRNPAGRRPSACFNAGL